MSARVERFPIAKILVPGGPGPRILTKERAVLDCGCNVVVGLRMDNHEVASSSCACEAKHDALVSDFNERLRASLADPQARPLVDVCAELLDEAEAAS